MMSEHWPLIGRDRSRDLNTGLWFASRFDDLDEKYLGRPVSAWQSQGWKRQMTKWDFDNIYFVESSCFWKCPGDLIWLTCLFIPNMDEFDWYLLAIRHPKVVLTYLNFKIRPWSLGIKTSSRLDTWHSQV